MTFFGSERLRGQHDTGDDQQDRPKFQKTEARVFADQEKNADGDDHQRTHQAANFAVGAVAHRFDLGRSFWPPLGILVQTIPKDPSADQDQHDRPGLSENHSRCKRPKFREQHQNADADQDERADGFAVGSLRSN